MEVGESKGGLVALATPFVLMFFLSFPLSLFATSFSFFHTNVQQHMVACPEHMWFAYVRLRLWDKKRNCKQRVQRGKKIHKRVKLTRSDTKLFVKLTDGEMDR